MPTNKKHEYYYILKYIVHNKNVEIPFANKSTAEFCKADLKSAGIDAELVEVKYE